MFGGYGGFIQDPDKDGAYSIPLQQDRKPAESLKAILYAPSCQFDILSLDLLSNPTRSATFECRHLPTISLRGRISPLPLAGERLFLTISYEAWWDHHFFGFADGMVQSFKVGTAFVQSDGHFQVQIPDFSKDRVTNEMQDASLRVLVLGHQDGCEAKRRKQDGGRELARPHGGHVRNRFEAARHRNSEGSLDPCDLPRPLLSSPQLSIA